MEMLPTFHHLDRLNTENADEHEMGGNHVFALQLCLIQQI